MGERPHKVFTRRHGELAISCASMMNSMVRSYAYVASPQTQYRDSLCLRLPAAIGRRLRRGGGGGCTLREVPHGLGYSF